MRTPALLAECLAQAWRLRQPLFVARLVILAMSVAIVAPFLGVTLNAAVMLSREPVLSDAAIARFFFLSPVGLAAFLGIASLTIVAALLELAVMTGIVRAGEGGMLATLERGFTPLAVRLVPLVRVALRLVLRLAVMVLPFAVTLAGLAWLLLSTHDINYYLTARPPVFIVAAGLAGLLVLLLVLLLARKLADWALVLHLVLFENRAPGAVFAASSALMRGHRAGLLEALAGWLGLRLAAGALISIAVTVLASFVLPSLEHSLHLLAAGMVLLIAVGFLVDAIVMAILNGALADLLYRHYAMGLVEPPALPTGDAHQRGTGRLRLRQRLALLALILLSSILGGTVILQQVQGEDEVAVIAHRGASAVRPENTLAAFEQAIAERADWIEIDVQTTADGEVVVVHDNDLMKIAGVARRVGDLAREDLASIDVGSWFDPAFADQRVPTLEEVLELARGRVGVLIELKTRPPGLEPEALEGDRQDLGARVIAIVEQAGMENEIAVMSLDHEAVLRVAALRPEFSTGALAARAIGDLTALDVDFLAVEAGMVSARLVRAVHDARKALYVWTVNNPTAMSRLVSLGVDGLITDRPEVARAVLEERASLDLAGRLMLWFTEELEIAVASEPAEPPALRP